MYQICRLKVISNKRKLVYTLIYIYFIVGFFDLFDKNGDDHIDFKEMVCGISTFCRGLTSERLEGMQV